MASAQAASGHGGPPLIPELPTTRSQFRESQRLRHHIYAKQPDTAAHGTPPRHGTDAFDRYSLHLLVHDRRSARAVAAVRILTDTQSSLCGSVAAERVFDFSAALAQPGRIVDIGRLCVEPGSRNEPAIGVLWAALARFLVIHRVDYVIGCVSMSLLEGPAGGHTAAGQPGVHIDAPAPLRARPRPPWSATRPTWAGGSVLPSVEAPPRQGAWVYGEPSLHHALGLATLSILLDVDRIDARYRGRFVPRRASVPTALLAEPVARIPKHAHHETYP